MYVNSLSKWVRGKLQHYDDCNQMLQSLSQFTADMKQFMANRRGEMEEKQASGREAKELNRSGLAQTEWAKEQEANLKMQMDKAEKRRKRTEIANLNAKTPVQADLSATSLLNSLSFSFNVGSNLTPSESSKRKKYTSETVPPKT